jgi:acetate kinase
MRVLTFNCGSSSLKFAVFEAFGPGNEALKCLGRGTVDRIGGPATVRFSTGGAAESVVEEEIGDHAEAVTAAMQLLDSAGLASGVDATGHRVVHGGPTFNGPVVIDDEVLKSIDALSELAPLHNQPAVAAIKAARHHFGPDVPMVATFDTGFFSALPAVAASYALPIDLVQRLQIRRYGFHGLAHRYMVGRFQELRPDIKSPRVISFQLGSGCSVAASAGGPPLDTSMGFTPLEGLIMGTRSGDLDPSLALYIAEHEGLSATETEALLNKRSGLLGLSGRSADMRDLLEQATAGEERASLAVDAFCYRAKKYLGAYLAVLGGADGVVFGGGIGEHSAEIRARICEGMAWAGVELDETANNEGEPETRISTLSGATDIRVIAVDEESVIAGDTVRCLLPHGSLDANPKLD